MSHRSDKGWTDIYLFLFRDGPLEITGGRVKNVWCMNFFLKPACLQEFFSRAYDLFFLDITACRIFLDKFPLQEFFWGELSPHLRLFPMVLPLLEDPQIVTMTI